MGGECAQGGVKTWTSFHSNSLDSFTSRVSASDMLVWGSTVWSVCLVRETLHLDMLHPLWDNRGPFKIAVVFGSHSVSSRKFEERFGQDAASLTDSVTRDE